MDRMQKSAVERLALEHGRVAVREGFADEHVDLTVPSGEWFRVAECSGVPVPAGVNFSIRWEA